jgi:hypothetical protein
MLEAALGAIDQSLRNTYLFGRAAVEFLKHEWESQVPVPFSRRLGMWRRGFYAEAAVIYDFPRNNHRDYITDYQRAARCIRINQRPGLYHYKLNLRSWLLALGFRQPQTVALITDGRILIDPLGPGARYASAAGLAEWLSESGGGAGRYIVKAEDEGSGKGIFLLEQLGSEVVRRRGRASEPFDISAFAAPSPRMGPRVIIIERQIAQGEFWRGLFPGSGNTIRVATAWTPGETEPFIARAVQRIGTTDTAPTDNWSGGGISAPIDLSTGRLGEGRMHPGKGKRAQTTFSAHPDSGTQIEGAILPHWDRIMDVALRAAGRFPFNPWVGWDILVDDAGSPVILEGNSSSDVNLLQAHGGLLINPRVRNFFAKQRVIR